VSWLKILLYYAVAGALTLHLVGVAHERSAAFAPVLEDRKPFLEAVPERIDRVRVEGDDLAVQFERRDGRWAVTEPEGLAPPGDVVDALLETLTSLPAIEIVSDGVQHEGQFGLVPARARIRIEQGGALVATIVLGELSPTRTAVYAKKSGKEEVALIGLNVRRQKLSSGASSPAPKLGQDKATE
jgi:hypothetical protein